MCGDTTLEILFQLKKIYMHVLDVTINFEILFVSPLLLSENYLLPKSIRYVQTNLLVTSEVSWLLERGFSEKIRKEFQQVRSYQREELLAK